MKNIALAFYLVIFSIIPCFAQVPQISPEPLPEFDYFTAMTAKGNNVFLLAVAKPSKGETQGKTVLAKYETGKWQQIPVIKNENNSSDTLRIASSYTQMLFDRTGSLWINAGMNGLWKYDGTNWNSYKLEDMFSSERRYGAMTCDSSGNIWVMTQIFGANEQSALLKFNGESFEIVRKS